MWDVSAVSTYSWDNRGKKLIISSNINNYKTLHLHRTFHFKTLRESEGKEKIFFCFFPSEENNTERGGECFPPLICFKQILAPKLHSPPLIWTLRVLPPLLSVKIKQVTCSFFPQSSWPVAQNDKPVEVFRSLLMKSREVWYKPASSYCFTGCHSVLTVLWVLNRIYTCRYISWRYGFLYIIMCVLEGFLSPTKRTTIQVPCLTGQCRTWKDYGVCLVQPPSFDSRYYWVSFRSLLTDTFDFLRTGFQCL